MTTKKTDDDELVYRLLYLALIEIRENGRADKNKVVYHLADLFHNVPLSMRRAKNGEVTHSEILKSIRDHAKDIGCERWLETRIQEFCERKSSDRE